MRFVRTGVADNARLRNRRRGGGIITTGLPRVYRLVTIQPRLFFASFFAQPSCAWVGALARFVWPWASFVRDDVCLCRQGMGGVDLGQPFPVF